MLCSFYAFSLNMFRFIPDIDNHLIALLKQNNEGGGFVVPLLLENQGLSPIA